MTLPVCIITGRIAGDSDACGDCDPCSAAHAVPDAVKRLIADKEEWRDKYAAAMCALDIARTALLNIERRSEEGRAELSELLGHG